MKTKYTILIALIVNFIFRIPRMLYAQGSDGFTALWEAQLILNGEYFKNGYNFFTLLGLTPFSGYPIGFLLILCFFLLITSKHIMITILLFDLVFVTIFVISAYYLSNEFEVKESTKLYFVIILTSLPNLFSFSYYQTSSRFPFFALLPLILMLLIRFNKKKKIAPLIIAISLSLILNFIHRMAIILLGIVFISLIFFVIEKLSGRKFLLDLHNKVIPIEFRDNQEKINSFKYKAKMNIIRIVNYIKQRLWIFSILGLFAIGFLIFGTNLQNVIFRSKFNIFCYLTAIIDSEIAYLLVQPIVDQWFHYGIPFILFIIMIIILLIPKFNQALKGINENSSYLYLIYFSLPFVLVYQLIYSYYFICYIIALISAIFLEIMLNKKYKHYLWPIVGIIVSSFIITYHFVTETKVLPYFILGLFILGISIITIILLSINKSRKWLSLKISDYYNKTRLFVVLFFAITIFNSMFIVDRSILFTKRNISIYEHITAEEIEIAEFLKQKGFGTFESFDYTLSTHIAVLSGWYFIQDQHNIGVFLLENRNLTEIECNFTLFANWPNMELFECSHTYGRGILYSQLFVINCYSINALYILKKYNIRYFISSRYTNTSYAWEYTVNSVFIESLYSYVPLAKITDNYYVWNTSTLYS